MSIKYQVHNQLTGLLEESSSFEDAKILQARIRSEYYAQIEGVFAISVLVQNEDESWTQSQSDEEGNPIIVDYTELYLGSEVTSV